MFRILVLSFSLLGSFFLYGRESNLYEKSSGNAFSVQPALRSAYIYNPAILGYNKSRMMGPLKLTLGSDSSIRSFLFNPKKYSGLKRLELVQKIKELSSKTPYYHTDVGSFSIFGNFAIALHLQLESSLKVSEGLIPTVEISTMETVKAYFSHGFAFGDFSFGYTIKPSFSIAHETMQDALNFDVAILDAHKEGTKLLDLYFTLGGMWRYKFLKRHYLILTGTANNIGIHIAKFDKREGKKYEVESFKGRFGLGLLSKWPQLWLRTKIFSTFESDYSTYASHHFGLSLKFLDLIDLRFGLENLDYSFGAFLVNNFIEFGVATTVLRSKSLTSNNKVRVLSAVLGASFSF